ncbi:hypothetical protein TPHA_0B03030 [Tetrapisispora phaffii CBS 4417]|uniref:Ribosome biogenesis protein UTP30 n=1 Tax=Tetrapisispora phaffii (strain ATCC 24235 / CBS 4417 / NBRC 1672 / NRRL Y-8282 / UCD 70-5) TaxID=1071381 RepID=G8BPP4_TETPH|nr:hypothetical protein TPHA_0B03030 [Tetrapisispora phaffii CBS 4417]CCE61975.1 hypothetical protein TPHA_0B03030 [Tetrapisispora phaffii CBS 4417]
MSTNLKLNKKKNVQQALESLIHVHEVDPKLVNDKNVHVQITMGKKMGITKDYVPRIIPLSSKMTTPSQLNILLVTKDPSQFYKETLSNDANTSEMFKEIISVKNLKKRFRGAKLNQLYKDFDLIVADFRVHHLLPAILGNKFYNSNKKLPFVVKLSRAEKLRFQKQKEECDPKYVRAQIRSICKNTSYVPNNDNLVSVKIGIFGKHTVEEMMENINDVVTFLSDKSKKPQGGVIKGGVSSVFVKSSNSASLPIYERPQEIESKKQLPLL